MCFPIKQADGRTIGVAELCNKAGPGGEGHFTFFDQVHVTYDEVFGCRAPVFETMENFKQSLSYYAVKICKRNGLENLELV